MQNATCGGCGNVLNAEERIVSAIFSKSLCFDCSKHNHEAEYPAITVNGKPLDEFLTKQYEQRKTEELDPKMVEIYTEDLEGR